MRDRARSEGKAKSFTGEEYKLPPRRRWYREAATQLRRQPLALVGMVIIAIVVIVAIFAPWLAPYDPVEMDLGNLFAPPSLEHPLGTDYVGRDLLSRVMHGVRISLLMVAFVLGISVPFGLAVGALAGYTGGWFDNLLMRTTDIFMAFPALVLAFAIAMFAVSLVWWPWYARLARGQVLSVKQNLYVVSAQSLGAGHGRIIFRHILPTCISPILILATLDVGLVILVTSSLSFIGLGASPPTPELGSMIEETRVFLLEYPWIPTFPGLAITFIALGFNLFGDGLRDILDPTKRGR
ncbi:ABC transporter permease [Chloroflexota bacterium]